LRLSHGNPEVMPGMDLYTGVSQKSAWGKFEGHFEPAAERNQKKTRVTALSMQPERSPRTLPGYGRGPLRTIGLIVLEILPKIAHLEALSGVDFLISYHWR
jgi:hypothetical protein